MKLLCQGLALLLAALLLAALLGVSYAIAAETEDATAKAAEVAEREARWERLLSFATEQYADWDAYDITFEYLSAGRYEQETDGKLEEYALVEDLYLDAFNQAQFEEILPLMPKLRKLYLTDCELQDYSALLRVPSLEMLRLGWSESLPEQVATLERLPALKRLELSDVPADTDLSYLLPVASKLTLSLEWRPGLPELLVTLPGLKMLKLVAPTDTDISFLAALNSLEELEIYFCTVDFDAEEETMLPEVPKLPKLRSLGLYGDGSGWGSVISNLPDLPSLESFDTNAAIDLTLLQHVPALRVLSIPGADDFSTLSTLKALEEIYIEWYLPDDLSPLHGLPALRLLQIAGNHACPVSDYLEQLEALYDVKPNIEIVLYYCC